MKPAGPESPGPQEHDSFDFEFVRCCISPDSGGQILWDHSEVQAWGHPVSGVSIGRPGNDRLEGSGRFGCTSPPSLSAWTSPMSQVRETKVGHGRPSPNHTHASSKKLAFPGAVKWSFLD